MIVIIHHICLSFQYRLKTFRETRSAEWCQRPYRGKIPNSWSITQLKVVFLLPTCCLNHMRNTVLSYFLKWSNEWTANNIRIVFVNVCMCVCVCVCVCVCMCVLGKPVKETAIQAVPGLWEIPVQAPPFFKDHELCIKVPHTSSVKVYSEGWDIPLSLSLSPPSLSLPLSHTHTHTHTLSHKAWLRSLIVLK